MKTSICKCGLIDGCVNALLFFLALDIATSTLVTGYDIGLIVICVCAVLSAALFFFLAKRTYDSVARCFWTGLLYFVMAGTVLFFCQVAGLHVFPRREMADAEGIMFLLFDGLYLVLSVSLRVICILLAKLKTAKTNP